MALCHILHEDFTRYNEYLTDCYICFDRARRTVCHRMGPRHIDEEDQGRTPLRRGALSFENINRIHYISKPSAVPGS